MTHHIILSTGAENRYEPETKDGDEMCSFAVDADRQSQSIRNSVRVDLQKAGLRLTDIAEDVLNLAMATYSADLYVRRSTGFDSWTRDFRLHLPVVDEDRWRENGELVTELLSFLSGDHWSLAIRGRKTHAEPKAEKAIPSAFDATAVTLFSGGLDSFIGTIERLEEGERLTLVGHHGAGSTNQAQVQAHQFIEDGYKDKSQSMRFYVQPPMPDGEPEKTTRSRSILFLALGHAVAAGGIKPLPLHVPENGLISLNPPLTASRMGTLSTRTTHPHFMDLFARLVNNLGSGVSLKTPYRFQTKGEMAMALRTNSVFISGVHQTVSCSHPDVGRYLGQSPGQHCGYCVPCIIRRAALAKAGLDDSSRYLNDLAAIRPANDSKTNRDLRAFEMAVSRFVPDDGARHLFDVLSTGPLPSADVDELAAVYRRGMIEVRDFLTTIG